MMRDIKINLICVVTQITIIFFSRNCMRTFQRNHNRYNGDDVSGQWPCVSRGIETLGFCFCILCLSSGESRCKGSQLWLLLDPYSYWKSLKKKSLFRVWLLTNLLRLTLSLLVYTGKDSKRWFVHPRLNFLVTEVSNDSSPMWQPAHFLALT